MGMALKGILAVFWLLLVPAAAGAPLLRKKDGYTLGECFLMGWICLLALSELLILPMMYGRLPLHILTASYGVLAVLIGAAGAWRLFRDRREAAGRIRQGFRSSSPYLWAAALAVGIQIYVVVRYAHMDADDSFYVGVASASVHTDTIMQVNPYTGSYASGFPSRYVLSPFPVFLAVVSELCAGLHPAITAHMVFPAVFFLMVYLVLFLLGKKWFPDDRRAQGIFLILAAVLNWFAGYSIYNAGNFQMVRIWQGKALLAAALLPLLFLLCLDILMEEKPAYPWYFLGIGNLACCFVSSMGVILAPLMTGCFLVTSLIRFRDGKRLAGGLICCIPSIVLGIAYLLIK